MTDWDKLLAARAVLESVIESRDSVRCKMLGTEKSYDTLVAHGQINKGETKGSMRNRIKVVRQLLMEASEDLCNGK